MRIQPNEFRMSAVDIVHHPSAWLFGLEDFHLQRPFVIALVLPDKEWWVKRVREGDLNKSENEDEKENGRRQRMLAIVQFKRKITKRIFNCSLPGLAVLFLRIGRHRNVGCVEGRRPKRKR